MSAIHLINAEPVRAGKSGSRRSSCEGFYNHTQGLHRFKLGLAPDFSICRADEVSYLSRQSCSIE